MKSGDNTAGEKPVGWCMGGGSLSKVFPQMQWENLGRSSVTDICTELENRRSRLCLAPISYYSLPALARQGWIRPLDRWFTPKDMERYVPQAVELSMVDGRLYGIPDDINPFAFFVRRDILNSFHLDPPRTWEEVEQLAIRIRKEEGKMLHFHGGGAGLRMGFLLSLLGSNGVPLVDSPREVLKDPLLLLSAYEWVRRLTGEHGVLAPESLTTPRRVGKRIPLLESAAGFIWVSGFFEGRPLPVSQYVLLPFPYGPGLPSGVEPYVPMRGTCWCIPWSKENPETAASVLREMHGPAMRRELKSAEEFPFYALRECWNDPVIQRRYPLYRYAEGLVCGKRPVLADPEQSFFRRLEVTFRNALLDDLDGRGWLEDLASGSVTVPPGGKPPPFRLILSGIESRIGRVRGINEMAREMGMRPERLRRLFSKDMGQELKDYLRKRRMDLARGMLVDGSFSVKEVSMRVGYRSAAAFCRAYHAHWGRPPRAEWISNRKPEAG